MARVSRRAVLRAGLALGVTAAFGPLAACGGPSGPVSPLPAETLGVTLSELEPSLDPHGWTTARGPRTLAPLFDALTFVQSDGKLRPALAIAWSQTSPASWQFRLRVDDAKFSNGELFSPESVMVTFQRLQSGSLPLSPLAANVDRVEVLDPATVLISLKQPDAAFPRRASLIYMLPPRYFGQVGDSGFAAQPVGTGFWQLDDYQAGQRLSLALFRDTWRAARGTDPPPLNRLIMQATPSKDQRISALRSLDVDLATELGPEDAKPLQEAGFAVQTADLGKAGQDDAGWEQQVFGGPLTTGVDVLATASNIKGVTSLPDGSWWFDRVTKTGMQRIAVAGGA